MNDRQISASGIKRCRNHRIQSRCTTWHTLFGIAQMMRVGLYLAVHVKTLRSQKLRMLLTHRKLLQSKAIAIDNDLRATLRNFGSRLAWWERSGSRPVSGSLSKTCPTWRRWLNHCSLFARLYANSSASCIAACWPSCQKVPKRGLQIDARHAGQAAQRLDCLPVASASVP